MTAKKRFWVSILSAFVMALSFWLSATNSIDRPLANPDPLILANPDPSVRAIRLASRLTDTANDQLIRHWLFTLVLTNRYKFAYEFARETTTHRGRFQAYLHIADALTAIGNAHEAEQALQHATWSAGWINSTDAQLSARALMSARKREIDEAFKQARRITDRGILSDTLSTLSLFFTKRGNFDAANKAAHAEVYPWMPPRLLLGLAEALLDADQPERGKAVAQEAFDLTLRLPVSGFDVLKEFAPVIVRAGRINELLETFQTLEKRIWISDQSFEAIAIGFAKLGNLDKALAVARSISRDAPITYFLNDGRARALAEVSQVLREAGAKDEAELILTEALETALRIEFPAHRSWALHKIVPLLVKVGRKEEAIRAAHGIEFSDKELLASLAVALAENGHVDEAAQATAEAFTSTNFETTIVGSGALLALVKANLNHNRIADARKLVETARQKLLQIKDPQFKSSAYKAVAEALALVGEWELAVTTIDLCEQEIDRLSACTAIVREHSIAHNSAFADVFKKAIE